MTDATARKNTLTKYVARHPDHASSQVVDYMMKKFPESKRHQHRAMLQRVLAKKPKPVPSKKALDVQKTGTRTVRVPVTRADTTRRRELMIARVLDSPDSSIDTLIEVVEDMPEASRMASRAMASMVHSTWRTILAKDVDEESREEVLRNRLRLRLAKLNPAECPRCGKKARFEDEVEIVFGYRINATIRQSNCRRCRSKS